MKNLIQPIVSNQPEPGHHARSVLTIEEFIRLLKEEEDYWAPEQNNTKRMITRLRKIFYDQWGWNSELIRGAAAIESRFETALHDSPVNHGKEVVRYKKLVYMPVYRVVTYTDHDKVFGDTRAGKVPFIYEADHQDVMLPEGHFCDVAHTLAGLDAINYKQVVSPLPSFLSFLTPFVPHVDSNVDVVTWLGDIASSSADFLFDYLKNNGKSVNGNDAQEVINVDASASDMLGDIDAYVIAHHYEIGSSNGMRCTELLTDYYLGDNGYRARRFSTFCSVIGLEKWNGREFANEKQWLAYYRKQLRDSTSFVTYSVNEKTLSGVLLPLKIWFHWYDDALKLDLLLTIFLNALKHNLTLEK